MKYDFHQFLLILFDGGSEKILRCAIFWATEFLNFSLMQTFENWGGKINYCSCVLHQNFPIHQEETKHVFSAWLHFNNFLSVIILIGVHCALWLSKIEGTGLHWEQNCAWQWRQTIWQVWLPCSVFVAQTPRLASVKLIWNGIRGINKGNNIYGEPWH